MLREVIYLQLLVQSAYLTVITKGEASWYL